MSTCSQTDLSTDKKRAAVANTILSSSFRVFLFSPPLYFLRQVISLQANRIYLPVITSLTMANNVNNSSYFSSLPFYPCLPFVSPPLLPLYFHRTFSSFQHIFFLATCSVMKTMAVADAATHASKSFTPP
jgi:hypothetical protein